MGVFNKTIPLVLVGYEMIIAKEVCNANLAIYHLISNVHLWSNIVKCPLRRGHLITRGVRTISVENVLKVTPTLHSNLATMIKMPFLLCSVDSISI